VHSLRSYNYGSQLVVGLFLSQCCADAIFTLKSTISYFADGGSSVFVTSLDISKAFDSVNHFKLYSSLLRVGIPVMVIDVLCD